MDTKSENLEEKLIQILKQVENGKRLFCPACKKFTPFAHFKLYGKDFNGIQIETNNPKDLEEFEGYRYKCTKCLGNLDSNKIGEIEV